MIAFMQVKQKIKYDLRNLKDDEKLTLKTSKKDRYLIFYKQEQDLIIEEHGFNNQKFVFNLADEKEYLKTVKNLLRLEFPRSNRVWYGVSKKDQDIEG